jgi:hypothetical protein
MTTAIYKVALPKDEYDDLFERLENGKEIEITDRWGKSSRIYLKDGKIYDTDRFNGKFDYDREVEPLDTSKYDRFVYNTKWGEYIDNYSSTQSKSHRGPFESSHRSDQAVLMFPRRVSGRSFR